MLATTFIIILIWIQVNRYRNGHLKMYNDLYTNSKMYVINYISSLVS